MPGRQRSALGWSNWPKDKIVVDVATFGQAAYVAHGGFSAIDKAFDRQGRALLAELEDVVWSDAA